MRIVIDATAAVSGGKVYLDQLLAQFARLEPEHEFIVFHAGDFDDAMQRALTERFQFRRVSFAGSQRMPGLLKVLWRLLVLPRHLRQLQPDLLFSNAGFAPGLRPRATKLVVALHNSMPLRAELIAEERSPARQWRLRLLRRLMRRTLRHSDGSIVFSADTRRRVLAAFADVAHEPSVVHHGIDWDAAAPEINIDAAAYDAIDHAAPYLLYVSQFHRYKNLLRLLQAFALLGDKHPTLSLVLVGDAADRAYWREVAAEIARLNLGERVRHIPATARARLPALYRGAAAFVHPSLAETCSFPLLEALALGVPTAAARGSALPEIAGDAALYFDPYDPRDLAETLDRLLTDGELRAELSAKATARAREFSWERTARQTLQVFERIVKN